MSDGCDTCGPDPRAKKIGTWDGCGCWHCDCGVKIGRGYPMCLACGSERPPPRADGLPRLCDGEGPGLRPPMSPMCDSGGHDPQKEACEAIVVSLSREYVEHDTNFGGSDFVNVVAFRVAVRKAFDEGVEWARKSKP